jgi:hypothetical protein
VETEADDAQDAGDITPKQKAPVHFIKVESSRDFFEGRGLDVIAENDGGREFHMAGEGGVLSDNASDSDSSESPGRRAPWGTDHPCQDPLRERVPFLSQELELIGREYHRITSTNPRCKSVVKEFCKQSGKMRT